MPNVEGPRKVVDTTAGRPVMGQRVQLGRNRWFNLKGREVGFNPRTKAFIVGITDGPMEPMFTLRGDELRQTIAVFQDPFGRHTTKIGLLRAQRPQANATFGQIVKGQAEQEELLTIGRKYIRDLEGRYDNDATIDKKQATKAQYVTSNYAEKKDEGIQLRILLASLTTYGNILAALAEDPSKQVRQAVFQNPFASNYQLVGGPREGFFLSNPGTWGPQLATDSFPNRYSTGITINPYSFDPVRHLMVVSRARKQEVRELDEAFFFDGLDIIFHYIDALRSGRPLEWIDYDKGAIVRPTINWGTLPLEAIDGVMLGMNFGLGRLMELDGSTSSLKTTSWASQIQAHMQFSVLLKGFPYPQNDQIAAVCRSCPGFMEKLEEAYRNSALFIDGDENVTLFATRAPRSVGEMGIICRRASGLMDTDEATRRSIAKAMMTAIRIMEAHRQFTFNIISFGQRNRDKDIGQRFMLEIIPRGGLAYSELASQWVVDRFPEDFVGDLPKKLGALVQGWFPRKP